MVPGSETSGPNGLEISPDGRWFYIGAWGTQSFVRLSRGQTPVQRDAVPAEFRIDNLRMTPDGSILATGQGSKGNPMTTSNVARIDPSTLQLDEIIRRPNDEAFQYWDHGDPGRRRDLGWVAPRRQGRPLPGDTAIVAAVEARWPSLV